MTIQIVPSGDPSCDVCAGEPDRPMPGPGESWAARPSIRTICRTCLQNFHRDIELGGLVSDPSAPEPEAVEDPSQD